LADKHKRQFHDVKRILEKCGVKLRTMSAFTWLSICWNVGYCDHCNAISGTYKRRIP